MTHLKVTSLSKSYLKGKKQIQAVKNASFSVDGGEVLALLGLNGAGKTTTIKMIANLIEPDSGTIAFSGDDSRKTTRMAAVLEGNRNLYGRLTAFENLEYFGALRGLSIGKAKSRGMALLERFGLTEKAKVRAQRLSRGMQQRLAIACSLVHEPQLLLLDEPTLGVDYVNTQAIKELIADIKNDCSILLTTHHFEFAESVSDRVAIMREGEVIADQSVKELIGQFAVADAYQIEVAEPLSDAVQAKLKKIGADVKENLIHYRGPSETFYQVLAALKPLELVRVQKASPDFAASVMKLSRST